MKHLITIIGHARTGSNYLCKLIEESFPDIVSHYELFNKQMCHVNLDYKKRLENHYKTDNLHRVADNNPNDYTYFWAGAHGPVPSSKLTIAKGGKFIKKSLHL